MDAGVKRTREEEMSGENEKIAAVESDPTTTTSSSTTSTLTQEGASAKESSASNNDQNAMKDVSAGGGVNVEAENKGDDESAKTTTTTTEEEQGGGAPAAAAAAAEASTGGGAKGTPLNFKVTFKKDAWDVTQFGSENTVLEVKEHLAKLSGLPKEMQKLMFKGMLKNESTLSAAGVKDGVKIMLVGASPQEIVNVAQSSLQSSVGPFIESLAAALPTPLCQQEQHKKILEKGLPPNAHPGLPGVQESLPAQPIQGILNRRGEPVQVSYKWDRDELWIGSKTNTEKMPAMTISGVTSEPITGQEGYHIVTIAMGTATKIHLYYFPAQFVVALRRAILH